MSIPLKSTIPESEFQEFWRYRYKYSKRSLDCNHYILAYYVRRYADDADKDRKSVVDDQL